MLGLAVFVGCSRASDGQPSATKPPATAAPASATRSPATAAPATHARRIDEWTQAASDWRTLPVVARVDEARATSSWDEKTRTHRWRAPLGDVFVTFDEIVTCDWGGSACAGSVPDCAGLRVGDLDDEGRPALTVDVKPAIQRRRCFLDLLSLRRTNDGRVFIVSLRDERGEERLAAAFTRSSSD